MISLSKRYKNCLLRQDLIAHCVILMPNLGLFKQVCTNNNAAFQCIFVFILFFTNIILFHLIVLFNFLQRGYWWMDEQMDEPMDGQNIWWIDQWMDKHTLLYRCDRCIWKWWFSTDFAIFTKALRTDQSTDRQTNGWTYPHIEMQ